jgi:hypothetical protein
VLHLPHEKCTVPIADKKRQRSSSLTSPLQHTDNGPCSSKGIFPWECDEADHAESPLAAYEHVVPVLEKLAKLLGKDAASLQIYDP